MAITLNDAASGYNLSAINSNFEKIESYLNNNVVSRSGNVAGETTMQRDLDMNGYDILNAKIDGFDLNLFTFELRRALRVPQNEAPLPPLASANERKGKILGFDADTGLPTVYIPASGSAADVLIQLSANNGASLVGYGAGTVKDAIDTINSETSGLSGIFSPDGFNLVGRYLNIAALRTATPTSAGNIVHVVSSYSSSATDVHVGGGYFESFSNVSSLPDDGGIIVASGTPGISWKRINFTSYDMQFWGVKADGATDNAAAITRATNYARNKKVILEAPAGDIYTSEMVPIYNYMGIRGHNRAEATVFYKTTNNKFAFKNGSTTVVSVDALAGFVPDVYDRADTSMASFVTNAQLEGCMFRRLGLTEAVVDTIRPEVGIYLNKGGALLLKQVTCEGGYIGMQGFNVFSSTFEQVAIKTWPGHGYSAFQISDVRTPGVYSLSGTSLDMRLVQVSGYQFGFEINALQYTTMTNCTAEVITPLAGETVCYAYTFVDPYSIQMNTCATEFVKGGQIRVTGSANPSFVRSLCVNGYLPIDQQNPVATTRIYLVDSGGVGQMKVTFMGGDLSRASLSNLSAPLSAGTNTKVVVINSGGEDWTTSGSGLFTRLA